MSNRKLFYHRGFTNIFKVLNRNYSALKNIKEMIYDYTKNDLTQHSSDLSLDEKLRVKFKKNVSIDYIKNLRRIIDRSKEFQKIVNNKNIKRIFKSIFHKPVLHPINQFRIILPTKNNIKYPYHQDEGTWLNFKNRIFQNKLVGTLWFSINGATKFNSIELIKKRNLLCHKFIKNKGFFNAVLNKNNIKKEESFIVEAEPNYGLIFHNLTPHRTILDKKRNNFLPRYSFDIRYYDKEVFLNHKESS